MNTTHQGGCHCGAVLFEVAAPACIEAVECNCSICSMTGYLHLLVNKDQLRILSGEDHLAIYTFNTKTARHLFCKTCGIKPFYVPRSHPAGYSVNVRCLNKETIESMAIVPFDGQHWEDSIAKLRADVKGA